MKLLPLITKELKELLTPTTILPAIIMMFIFASMGSMVGGMEKKAGEKPVVEIISYDNGSYAKFYENELEKYCKIGKEKIAVIILPENFSSNIENGSAAYIEIKWFLRGTGISSSPMISSLRRAIDLVNKKLTMRIAEGKINSSLIFYPVKSIDFSILRNKEMNIPPEKIISYFSSQSMSIPIIIMIMIVTSGGIIISSMGMEKENKTLETLLTLPIKRSYIIGGKIIGASIVGLIIAFLYMVGMHYYLSSFGIKQKLGIFSLSPFDYILIGISLFFSLLAGLSLCIVIGSFAKNYKSAQILSLPISILAIIPMFILMFQDFLSMNGLLKSMVFLIPFSHPMMTPSLLLLKEYFWVISGIAYSILFSLVCIFIAAWIFKTDLLITGRMRK